MTSASAHLEGHAATVQRSMVYARFAAAFEYPVAKYAAAVRAGVVVDALRPLLSAIDMSLIEGIDWEALKDAGSGEDALREEFTRLFEAGENGPACSLEGGQYSSSRMQTMEELVRFYNFFGVSLPEERQVQPDHLTTELEFLHYLTFKEAELHVEHTNADGLLRAQRDFIARHIGEWIPHLRKNLVDVGAMRFYVELTRLLERFLTLEVSRLMVETPPLIDET